MEDNPKLKTKLEFNFDTSDLEVPELDFLADDPIEKKEEIQVIKRKKRNGCKRKSTTDLF